MLQLHGALACAVQTASESLASASQRETSVTASAGCRVCARQRVFAQHPLPQHHAASWRGRWLPAALLLLVRRTRPTRQVQLPSPLQLQRRSAGHLAAIRQGRQVWWLEAPVAEEGWRARSPLVGAASAIPAATAHSVRMLHPCVHPTRMRRRARREERRVSQAARAECGAPASRRAMQSLGARPCCPLASSWAQVQARKSGLFPPPLQPESIPHSRMPAPGPAASPDWRQLQLRAEAFPTHAPSRAGCQYQLLQGGGDR